MFNSPSNNASEIITIPEIRGEYGQARVAFINAPFQRSRSKHLLSYPDADFGPMLLDEIFHKQRFFTKLKGVFKKTHHCRKCAAHLDTSQPERQMFEVAITHNPFPTFVLRIEVPAARCPLCSAPNALRPKEVEHDISEALIMAFESQNTKP